MGLADVIHMPEQPRTVQLENGFTRVAHGIVEALALADLSKRQYKAMLVLIRLTYGFNKKSDEISLSQLEEKTGVFKANMSLAIDELVSMNVIIRTPGKHAACLAINKAFQQWTGKAKVDSSKLWSYQNNNPKVIETMVAGYQNDNDGVIETITTKDNSKRNNQKTTPKQTLSVSLRETFEIFWAKYPKKKSRATAEKAFAKLNPNEQLLSDLMMGLERAVTSEQWSNPKFIPHAASWLNAGGWTDEIQSQYTDAERAVIQAFNDALGEQIGVIDASVFVESRAGAIRAFLGARPSDPDFWKRYFPAVREKVDMPPHAGLDWLISPKGFSDVLGRMAIKRNPDGTKAAGEWHTTASGIKAKAKSMGIAFHDDEPVPAIAARVRAVIQKSENRE